MPSFVNHTRTPTWPPSFPILDITLVTGSTKAVASRPEIRPGSPLPDIDDDPFAHFISPVNEEDDPYDIMSLSAGILPGDAPTPSSKAAKFKTSVAKKWARYVARNHQQLHGLFHDEAQEQTQHASPYVPDIREPDAEPQYRDAQGRPFKVELREPTRGRAQDLLTPERRKKGRGSGRAYAHHRHSWSEPSPQLFTVSEEEESSNTPATALSAPSTPTMTTIPIMETNDGESRRSQGTEAAEGMRARAKL